MNPVILQYVCAAGAVLSTLLFVFAWLNEKGINPLDEVISRYRRLPRLGQFLLPVIVAHLIVYGSTKAPTNEVDSGESSTTNSPSGNSSSTNAPAGVLLGLASPLLGTGFESGFTSNELASGYALWRIGTNEVWNFGLMSGARLSDDWRLRGAADDWTLCATTNLGPVAMTTGGRLITTNGVYAAYNGQLAIAPEVNWSLLGTNAPSRAWWAETPWHSTVFTWQNAFLGRDTNQPVSVQAEFTRTGDFIYRYDLASIGTNVTSLLYYRITSEDLEDADRDGDGLTTYEEVSVYHTDPGLVDSDGDGLSDNEEVWNETDPTVRSVPNEEIVARVIGSATNESYKLAWRPDPDHQLTTLKLWDGFAADWPEGMTNLVYERKLNLGTSNGWQHYFLSSKESAAGDWELRGLVLEWDDGQGAMGSATASPLGDSFPLPVTNATVTIRLRAIGPKIRCPKPMYLVGYAPTVSISGGRTICDESGEEKVYFLSASNTNLTLSVTIDRSHRPCNAPLSAAERALPGLANMLDGSNGAMAYDGNENGGTITVMRPVCCQLPAFAVDNPYTPAPRRLLMSGSNGASDDGGCKWIVCLDPSVKYGGDHKFVSTGIGYNEESGDYEITYYYPLDSKCLWRSWQKSESGYWECSCEPEVKAGADADDLSFVTKSCTVNSDRTVATGVVMIYGYEVWRGTAAHSWRDIGSGGGTSCGVELLSDWDECDEECYESCADGNCDTQSGSGLNSVKFRLSLGMPRTGQHSGFLYFESDGPVAVTANRLQIMERNDATVSDTTVGSTRTVTCYDQNGRSVAIAPIANGIRLTVSDQASGTLDETWEIVNESGDTNIVRITQKSRLDNVMSDETYGIDADGVWTMTDNITGVVETLERIDRTNDPSDGKLYETRTKYDADGNQLDCVSTETSRIGQFGNAVLRETYWEEDTGSQVKWRAAEYWNDAAHIDRHGQLKLLTGNCVAWEYHDYDVRGFETLRVEQRNGSSVPTDFPEVVAGELMWASGLADALVTVFDYTPFTGDDADADDVDRVRCETRYVVRNGRVTLIGRTWTRYTHVTHEGDLYDAVKAETWRASSPAASRENSANAYSYEVTYSETAAGIPLVLRGEIAEALDENGTLTEIEIEEENDVIRTVTRKSDELTYEVVERDSVFGNELRRATYLTACDVLINEEVSTYDAKNRLRSTTYLDGTLLTNAWSCCRKLWSVDREGRKTLRSAVTGQDRLYYADEEVWHRELSTNGEHKVTQHFFDGLGREIETAVYAASVAGEAMTASASVGKTVRVETTDYPNGGDDYRVSTDERGKVTVNERVSYGDREEHSELVYSSASAASPDMETQTTQYRNGQRVTEKTWGGKWTRERTIDDYTSGGCAVCYEVTESSDCRTVTNRIETCDFLGRTIQEVTPRGTTTTTYHGASMRTDVTTLTAGDIVRVTTTVYGDRNEQVGSEQDGVTNRTDVCYEMDVNGDWWKVTHSETSDGVEIESSSECREQLTGRESGVVGRRIDIDADGVVVETVERIGATDGERVTSVSNALSGVVTQIRRYGIERMTATPNETRQFATDALGRKTVETRQVNGISGVRTLPCEKIEYNAVDEIVSRRIYTNGTDAVTETFGYDSYGRLVSSVDALGNETETQYDAVGNITRRSGATWPVRYTYDTAGRCVSSATTKNGTIWDVTRWTYDPMTGKCMAKRYPDGSQVAYSHTADGLPLVTTLPSGRTMENVYDARRRKVGSASSDGASDASYGYDAFGRMTSASNAVAEYAYARHRNGLATNETATIDGTSRTVVRTVDAYGRQTGLRVSGGVGRTVTYDVLNRVSTIATDDATVTYAYGDDGADLGYVLTLANGTTVARRIVRDDYRQQIASVSNFVSGVCVGGIAYGRDAIGRTCEKRNGDAAERFVYDEIGQLVCQTSQTHFAAYAYDLIGNAAGSESLSYTTDGGVASLDGKVFAYDSSMRLTTVATGGVTIATYSYDSFGRRVRKAEQGKTTLYFHDGWNLVREETSGVTIDYVWGKDIAGSLDASGGVGGLLYLKRNGAIYIPLYDANGNVIAYVDASGATVCTFAYDAFGNTISETMNSSAAINFAFRYSTKYADDETGLYYYGYRYYAPTQSRWLTRDPLEEQGGLNLYAFCENDAVNRYDSLGLFPGVYSVSDARIKWWLFAEGFFRIFKDWKISAKFLKISVDGRPHDNEFHYEQDSGVSKAIKGSKEYSAKIDDIIDSASLGRNKFNNVSSGIEFTEGDLYAAIKKADFVYDGSVCKGRSGKIRVDLDITVKDTYDFSWWEMKDAKKSGAEGFVIMMGNNMAYMDQQMGAIVPFKWRACMRETRK